MGRKKQELLEITRGIRNLVQKETGADSVRWPRGSLATAPRASVPAPKISGEQKYFSVASRLAAYKDLPALQAAIKDCVRCSLGRTRTNFVFGDGNPKARLLFVGEAPGRDEDLQGRPFVGRAGQLLTKIIEAIGWKREDVFIANILKCRPPSNRPPEPAEIEQCWPHLAAQICLIQPKVIVALGSIGARALLKTDAPIGTLRGHFQERDGIPIMPTYHPAYLLRNPNEKGKVWEDMKKVRDLLKTL